MKERIKKPTKEEYASKRVKRFEAIMEREKKVALKEFVDKLMIKTVANGA